MMADKTAPYGLSALVTGQTAPPADIAKVKRNIQRLIEQNAPEEDIDAYVAFEGVTLDQLRQRSAAVDQRGKGVSVLQGATFGFGDEIVGAGTAGLRSIYDPKTGQWFSGDYGNKYDEELAGERELLGDMRAEHPYMSAGLEAGGAMLSGGGLAGAGMSAGANAIRAGQGLGRVAVASAGEGAAMGGAYGFGSGEGGVGNRIGNAEVGAATGLAAGAAVPYLAAGIGRAISPAQTSAARTQAANVLQREGIDLTAGQRTGSNGLRYAESELGGASAQDLMERQGEQFTAAVLRRTGTNANRATPDVIDDAFDRIGQQFDGLAQRNLLVPDRQMLGDLRAIQNEYMSLVPETQRAPIVANVIRDIQKTAGLRGPNGTHNIRGASYQSLRSSLDRAARGAKDPQLATALRGIKDSLDDAMERGIARNNPADLGAWREVRNQYRNMLVVEQAATGAGENAALGLISPSQLRNATVTKHGRRNYARGQGDFAELARAGEGLMKPLPNSGTAPRLARYMPGGVGITGALLTGDPVVGLAAAGASWAAPKVAGGILMSRPGQAYFGNQLMQRVSPATRGILNSMLVAEGAQAAEKLPRKVRGILGAD